MCCATCGSSAALAAHRAKAHCIYPDASFGFGTCCQVCLLECWSENRLRDHLKRHPACSRTYAASDISNGRQLSSKYVAAWQPVARVQGPQPWWATLAPLPHEEGANAQSTFSAAIKAPLRPAAAGQDELRTWILRLYKVLSRRGTPFAEDLPTSNAKAHEAFSAARFLFDHCRAGVEPSSNPICHEGWTVFVKSDRVELVRTPNT